MIEPPTILTPAFGPGRAQRACSRYRWRGGYGECADCPQARRIARDFHPSTSAKAEKAHAGGGTTGIRLAAAKLFVREGAYVFITGRRQKEVDEAVKAIGSNVTGVQGDVAKLADLDRLYETDEQMAAGTTD